MSFVVFIHGRLSEVGYGMVVTFWRCWVVVVCAPVLMIVPLVLVLVLALVTMVMILLLLLHLQ